MALHQVLLTFVVLVDPGLAAHISEQIEMNPIRRVVGLLQVMQEKVTEEATKEKELMDKFMCYCQTGGATLQKSISDDETKIPQLESAIQEGGAEKAQLTSDVEQHKKDRDEAKATVAEAKAIRAKEAAAFAKSSSEAQANIAALRAAVAALEKGVAGSFLQTPAASVLRRVAISMDLSEADRGVVASFLSATQGEGYVPRSGEIIGILKQMGDTMSADLKDMIAQEEQAKTDTAQLLAAKTKQIDILQKSIEEKIARLGESGVELVNMAEDLDDTKTSLAEDQKFLADLEGNCDTKAKEWAERQKTRAEEQLAIAETIKILNDDDALDLFKKTLPSPVVLLQAKVTNQEVRHRALAVLKVVVRGDPRFAFIELALQGKKADFSKVIRMIDEMVSILGKEQGTDDEKKANCELEFDKSDDEKKALERTISDLEKAIDEANASVASLTDEIAALTQGITDLDKQVTEATEQRKAEHQDFVDNLAANNAAKDVIAFAKNRLNKFYNPALYTPPPARELTEQQRVFSNMGGELAPTAAPGGIANTGITALDQTPVLVQLSMHAAEVDAPPPPPETFGAYAKKAESSNGVMSMMDLLTADLAKQTAEMEVEEKNAQEEYEQFMQDASDKRALDSKGIAEKQAAKADWEAQLQTNTAEQKATMKDAMATGEYIRNLHLSCDWLISNFDVRKAARAGEVASLKDAKAVLSGADYSLMQTVQSHLRRSADFSLMQTAQSHLRRSA